MVHMYSGQVGIEVPSTSGNTVGLQELPTELIHDIATRLNPFQLESLCLVCTTIYRDCQDLLRTHRQRKRQFGTICLGSESEFKNCLELVQKIYEEPIIAPYIRLLDVTASDLLDDHPYAAHNSWRKVTADEPFLRPLRTLQHGLKRPSDLDSTALRVSKSSGTVAVTLEGHRNGMNDEAWLTYNELEREAMGILPFLCFNVADLVLTNICPPGKFYTNYIRDLMAPNEAEANVDSISASSDRYPRKCRSVSASGRRYNRVMDITILSHLICAAPQTLQTLRVSRMLLCSPSSQAGNFGFPHRDCADNGVIDLQLYECYMESAFIREYIAKFLPGLKAFRYFHKLRENSGREYWSGYRMCKELADAFGGRLTDLCLVGLTGQAVWRDAIRYPITTFKNFPALKTLRVYAMWIEPDALRNLPGSLVFLGLQLGFTSDLRSPRVSRIQIEELDPPWAKKVLLSQDDAVSSSSATKLERLVFSRASKPFLDEMQLGMQNRHPGIVVAAHNMLEYDWWTGSIPR